MQNLEFSPFFFFGHTHAPGGKGDWEGLCPMGRTRDPQLSRYVDAVVPLRYKRFCSFIFLLNFYLCQVPYLNWPTHIQIPTKGALGVVVELPRKWITFAKSYMQPHEQHLATQCTRLVRYPPLGSLACQIFFHFFDLITNHYLHVYFFSD